jgi:hypothetical protein
MDAHARFGQHTSCHQRFAPGGRSEQDRNSSVESALYSGIL